MNIQKLRRLCPVGSQLILETDKYAGTTLNTISSVTNPTYTQVSSVTTTTSAGTETTVITTITSPGVSVITTATATSVATHSIRGTVVAYGVSENVVAATFPGRGAQNYPIEHVNLFRTGMFKPY